MINTICFDLDSTLVDSEMIIIKSFEHAFKTCLPEHIENNVYGYRKYIGPTLIQSFGLYTDDKNKIQECINEYLKFYKENEFSIVKIYPTVKETLAWLRKNNYNVCLLTNKYTSSAMPSLNHFDIAKYFNNMVTLDRQKFPKPDPYPILLSCEDYDVRPENVLMVGDNYVDIMCGKNAGAKTALVDYNSWFMDAKKAEPDYIISKIEDLIKILCEENK